MRKFLLLGISDRAINLVVVVVQAGNVCASELGNFTCRSTDTTADVKYRLTLLDTNLVRQVVLMAGNSLVKRLANGEATEVEGLTPAELVNVGSKVVVAVEKRSSSQQEIARGRIETIRRALRGKILTVLSR